MGEADSIGGDTALVRVVLEAVEENSPGMKLRFDPRPLRADPSIQGFPERVAGALASVSDTVMAKWADVAARRGISGADITSYLTCPGRMVLGPPEFRGDAKPHATCPPDEFAILILALPRRGGAYLPGSGIDRRAEAAPGAWTVRLIRRMLAPYGGGTFVADAVVERDACGGWTVVRVVPLLTID